MIEGAMGVRRLTIADEVALADLFVVIARDASAAYFSPHAFTREEAARVAAYSGLDLHLGLWSAGDLVGYGLLRGWDDGFEIPSLGIYVAPDVRGRGAALHFMLEMHRLAGERGATSVRLKVYPENVRAKALYEKLGYVFNGHERGQLVGYKELHV